jgi:hypothetical protein
LLCWGLYFTGTFSGIHGGDFAVFVYGAVLLAITAIAGLAWGIYGIVNLVQNKSKDELSSQMQHSIEKDLIG